MQKTGTFYLVLTDMIKHKNILLSLQKKYHKGGYALVSPRKGNVLAFGDDLELLYKTIEKKKITDKDELVMYIPPPSVKHVFHLSLSIRILRHS